MLLVSHAAAKCEIPTISGAAAQTSAVGFMYVDSGEPCRIGVLTSQAPSRSLSITQRASNGSARISGHGVEYRSRRGFKGKDSFTFVHHGSGFVRTIQMNVIVR
jgi:hypothetical protein